jgi:hypothetical protein
MAIYVFIGSKWTFNKEITAFTHRRGGQSKEDVSIHTPSGEYVKGIQVVRVP